tara:strand:- start:30 stop:266 length:237 start_codon:yes stop_codon:yes gene_type:complete
MPLNDKKIISIILKQCANVEERCEGYREEIVDVISDIIEYERQHRVQGTNIQKKINDKCNAAGRYLSEQRGDDMRTGD